MQDRAVCLSACVLIKIKMCLMLGFQFLYSLFFRTVHFRCIFLSLYYRSYCFTLSVTAVTATKSEFCFHVSRQSEDRWVQTGLNWFTVFLTFPNMALPNTLCSRKCLSVLVCSGQPHKVEESHQCCAVFAELLLKFSSEFNSCFSTWQIILQQRGLTEGAQRHLPTLPCKTNQTFTHITINSILFKVWWLIIFWHLTFSHTQAGVCRTGTSCKSGKLQRVQWPFFIT